MKWRLQAYEQPNWTEVFRGQAVIETGLFENRIRLSRVWLSLFVSSFEAVSFSKYMPHFSSVIFWFIAPHPDKKNAVSCCVLPLEGLARDADQTRYLRPHKSIAEERRRLRMWRPPTVNYVGDECLAAAAAVAVSVCVWPLSEVRV